MDQLNVILTKAWYVHHNYGIQGLILPVIDKLKKYFNDINFSIIVNKTVTREDFEFANKFNIHLIKYPGIITIPKSTDIFDKFFIYNYMQKLNLVKYKHDNKKNIIYNFLNSLKKNDVIIDIRGIEYIGNQPIKSKWINYANVSFLQYLAKDYNLVYIKNTKSYGPFNGQIFTHQVIKRLNELPFLLVRGKYNLDEFKKLKLKIPIYSSPDVSLSLEPESKYWARSYLAEKGINLSDSAIGISPSAVIRGIPENPGNTCGLNHYTLCKKLIEYFHKKGKPVIIIPHSIHDGKSERTCDLALSKKIYHDLIDSDDIFLLDDMNLTYKQVRAIIGLLDFYISGRYHSVCSALYMGVPIVCLSWHIKYKDIMSLFLENYKILNCRQISIKKSIDFITKYYSDRSWFDRYDVLKRRKDVNLQIDKSIRLIVEEIKNKLS